MAAIGKVSLDGLPQEKFHNTFLVKTGALQADVAVQGESAMALDTVANQVKLAADGDKILGRLEVLEVRTAEGITVGTVARKGGMSFKISPHVETSPDEMPGVGSYLVGSVDDDGKGGYVRKATTAEISAGKDNWLVVEIIEDGDDKTAIAIDA